MPVFVLMEEDAFASSVRDIAKGAQTGTAPSSTDSYIRRPLRGIQHKKDTHASIRVFRNDGSPVALENSARDPEQEATMTANFLLQSVNMPRQEKTQIIENFGEAFGFFSGERAQFAQFSVMLVNTIDFDWRSEWVHNYENVFRGTRLVEIGARLYIFFDDLLLEGYMINSTIDMNSQDPFLVPCTFSMWVTGHENMRRVGSTTFPGATPLTNSNSTITTRTYEVLSNTAAGVQTSSFYNATDEYLQRRNDDRQTQARADAQAAANPSTAEQVFAAIGNGVLSLLGLDTLDDDGVTLMSSNGSEVGAVTFGGIVAADSILPTEDP